ncbi:hypothetical protein, partial [Streptomyces sp. NPDC047968]|uniref:hypothetical protein n=1 Tax=Streptomyces sp. NPDC047968 TaxID=3155382 RepID=UPI00341D412F
MSDLGQGFAEAARRDWFVAVDGRGRSWVLVGAGHGRVLQRLLHRQVLVMMLNQLSQLEHHTEPGVGGVSLGVSTKVRLLFTGRPGVERAG